MGIWKSPTGFNDPDSKWQFEENTYDDNVETSAACSFDSGWSKYLELTIDAIYCNKAKIYVVYNVDILKWAIDVYYNDEWHNIFSEAITTGWNEAELDDIYSVTAMRIRACTNDFCPVTARLFEASFYNTPPPPTLTVEAATDILPTTATGNGTITDTGGEDNTERGFEYKDGGTPQDITGATQENPCKITVVGHSYSTNDNVIINDVVGMTELNGKTYKITKIDDDNFTLTSIDATEYTGYTSGGKVAKWEGEIIKAYDTGDFGVGAFTKGLTDLNPYTKYYIRAYSVNTGGTGYSLWIYFTTEKTIPTVTTQDVTDIGQNQVKGNGTIVNTGGEDCTERGFQYGYTKTATWTEKVDIGGYEAGAFYLTISGLMANTIYWYRAYAKNTVDTYYGYGEWIKFQTSAAGTTATGTKINICSDQSGYTYILNESLTDDGYTYESYFTISTDLADKQGLHFKKRLEDLYSYFEKKDGTCKIYIKRDSETTWQYCGEISMTGEDDIVVPHLPSENQDSSGDVDWLAKHFLIRFEFENDFSFIGLITEAVPIGVR